MKDKRLGHITKGKKVMTIVEFKELLLRETIINFNKNKRWNNYKSKVREIVYG